MLMGLLSVMPGIVYADTVERVGDFTITVADEPAADYSFDEATGTLSISSGTLTVANADPSTPTTNRIHITGSSDVTFAGLNLIDNGGHPVRVDDAAGTQVIIRLANSNVIAASGWETSGIYKGSGEGTLKITSVAGDGSDDGEISITCGGHAACIGAAGYKANMSNLEIAGGTYHLSVPRDSSTYTFSSPIGGSNWGMSLDSTISGGHLVVDSRQSIFGHSPSSSNCTMTGGILQMSQDCSIRGTIQAGIVSWDDGVTYSVYGDTSLEFPFEIPENSSLDIPKGSSLAIGGDGSLINNGTIFVAGTLDGPITNNGIVYDEGGLDRTQVSGIGEIRMGYVEVENGSGSGTYAQGETVEISAEKPADGMAFVRWEVVHGGAVLKDATSLSTSFPMPEGCVVLRPVYAPIIAKVTSANGEQRYIADSDEYSVTIETKPGDLIEVVPQSGNDLPRFNISPFESVTLDLAGETIEFGEYIRPSGTSRIQNGSILGSSFSIVLDSGELTLENVTCTGVFRCDVRTSATLVVGDGVLFPDGIMFLGGGTIRTACTDNRDYGTGVTLDKRHAWDEGAFEDGHVIYVCTACGATRTEGENLTLGNVAIDLSDVGVTYDGAEITADELGLNAKRGETDAGSEVVFSYAPVLSDGLFGDEADGLPFEAGNYRVTASLPTFISENMAYMHESASCIVTISPKPVEVAVSGLTAATKTYDGTTDVKIDASNTSISLLGVLPQDNGSVELTYRALVGHFADSVAGENKPIQLALEGAELSDPNYLFSGTVKSDATASIVPREVGLIWHNTENRVSGDGLTVTAELTNTVVDDDVYAKVSGGDATAIGAHVASAAIAGSDANNYIFPSDARTSANYCIASASGSEEGNSSQPDLSAEASDDNLSQQPIPATGDPNGPMLMAPLIMGGCAAAAIGIALRHRIWR